MNDEIKDNSINESSLVDNETGIKKIGKFVCPKCGGNRLVQSEKVWQNFDVLTFLLLDGCIVVGDCELESSNASEDDSSYFSCKDCYYDPSESEIVENIKFNK